MGNVCSSGKKKRTDNGSEKSIESPAYIPSECTVNNTNAKYEGFAPLADLEIDQDVRKNNEHLIKIETTEFSTNSINGKNYNNVASIMVERSESSSSTNVQQEPETHLLYRSADNFKNLLRGKPLQGRQIQRNKKIVLYMLADNTSDYKIHSKIVHNLYDKMTQMCRSYGFSFMIANIHERESYNIRDTTGLSSIKSLTHYPLEADGGHEEAANCLSEISRHTLNSYLVPILFLGNNLGHPMLPLTIESQDFKFVLNAATENEISMLEKWYVIDGSYKPLCHRLQTEKLNCSYNIYEQADELNDLLKLLLKLFTDDLKDSYLTTVVEQEINHTVLMSEDLSKRCIWVQSEPHNIQLPESATILEKEIFRRVSKIYTKMKSHLSEKNILRISQNINFEDELQFAIEDLMERLVISIWEDYEQRTVIPLNTFGVDRVLLEELHKIGHFSKILAQNAANFDIMNDVKQYILDQNKYPLVIFGTTGCGKSVLVSKIMENIIRWKPEANLILRYANLSVHSADMLSVVRSIANQMSFLAFGYQIKCKHSLMSYGKIIQNILNSALQFYVIVIDGVSELYQTNFLQWLPINLNNTSKIILTVTQCENILKNRDEGSEQEENKRFNNIHLKSLADSGIPLKCFLNMDVFSKSQWQDILDSGGGKYYTANSSLKLSSCCRDLQGKTAFHAKCLWWLAWMGQFKTQINDINEIIVKMLNIIENKFDKDDTRFLLLVISSSEHGISETDCLEIFQKYKLCETHNIYRKWAKFCWIMGPLLIHLNNVHVADEIFRSAIKKNFSHDYKKVNKLLHNFYESQPSNYGVCSGHFTALNVQKFKNLPYHHLCMTLEANTTTSENFGVLFHCNYFTDFKWIMNKVEACGPAFLMHDILTAENFTNLNSTNQCFVHINFIKEFLTKFIYELSYDGSQFLTFFNYFIKIYINSDMSLLRNGIINGWIKHSNELKTPYLQICNIGSEFYLNDEEELSKLICNDQDTEKNNSYDVLLNLPQSGYYVASMSSERDEICIWDVLSCQKIRRLNGIPQPTAMCPVANYDAAVLCRREIKVINLDEGEFKVTLKGVMNQKMPYFGLHDQNHLVCLSRNRMYVNLMNLETGDCVTTFKAGEDRFLNSLLVSGDGRILVCGDETQKPFPLLVWHLTQRKLLYDLRIPHHDFVTALSAITHEGSYVCVVAKELNEPTPNFIVVYDLQSGTLFKKWKPNCNTVSLAISQLKACVIAGLENAKILIWDLITGNCRSTFIGHNAPVTFLKLDPLGKVLLSRDKEGRDNAIRVWDLSSGKFLASYKPPSKILCSEILPNGTHIILALKMCPNILVLALKNSSESLTENNIYGKKENYGKTFQLNLS